MPDRPLRVVVADDSVLLREGVARLLAETGFQVAATAGTGKELLELVAREQPDVAIIDIRMPPTHSLEGLEAAERIRAERPGTGVLVLSQYVEPAYALRLVQEGARGIGYLLKDRLDDVAELSDAVRRIAAGGTVIDSAVVAQLVGRQRPGRDRLAELTEREREVLSLMAQGRSNQAICERLHVQPKTVEAHIASIFSKLELQPAAEDHRRVLAVLAYLGRAGDKAVTPGW